MQRYRTSCNIRVSSGSHKRVKCPCSQALIPEPLNLRQRRRVRIQVLAKRRHSEGRTYQAKLKGPHSSRPQLDDLVWLALFREVDLDAVPPALALKEGVNVRNTCLARSGALRTAGFRQKSSSFCAVAIWL